VGGRRGEGGGGGGRGAHSLSDFTTVLPFASAVIHFAWKTGIWPKSCLQSAACGSALVASSIESGTSVDLSGAEQVVRHSTHSTIHTCNYAPTFSGAV
jgi:hypothetical protein